MAIAGSGARLGPGARMFCRVMTWACVALSVATACVVAGALGLVLIFETTHAIPCTSGALDKTYVKANFECHANTTTTTTVRSKDGTSRTTVETKSTTDPERGLTLSDLSLLFYATPPLLLAVALWQAAGFFRQLFKGRALSAATVRKLRDFSLLGVLYLVLNPNIEFLTSTVFGALKITPTPVTLHLSPILGWSPSGGDIMTLFFAATLIAMVSVLARAAALADDHAQIV